MKTKFISLFALVLCIGAFLLPITAHAAVSADGSRVPDTTPPTVSAKITGNALGIEAKDADSGVEAVFIDEKRFNYRVDGALEVDARDYVSDGETVSVYAVDFAGNKSKVVTLENPYFVAPVQENPFTPSGQASVVDQATESDGKDFYSFATPEGNVFYLVIDHQRNADNVYFLNAITEDDLAALAEKSDKKGSSGIPVSEPPPTPPEPTETPTSTEPPQKDNSNSGTMIFIVLAVLAAGGAGYYFKIVRPKQQMANAEDEPEDEDGYDEEYDSEEDEDEQEETEETDTNEE